jgi:hypothetical protein
LNTLALTKASSIALALATVSLVACSAGKGDVGEDNPGGGSGGFIFGSGGASNGGLIGGGGGGTTGTGGLIVGGGLTSGSGSSKGSGGNPGECASVAEEAEKIAGGKADIIWAIDTSGSMLEETAAVQANLNTFSQFITGTGIDVHVIMVAVAGLTIPNPFDPAAPPIQLGICIAPPLGSGQACPNDTNPPRYTHVLQEVGSHDVLSLWQSTYPQWQSALRPDSTKTFVVVTDDEAEGTTAAQFRAFFDNAFGAGSTWRYSGIFCKQDGGNCAGAGTVHDQLVTETGGVWADLSNPTPDWNAIFKQLSDAVIADAKPVDCEWKIPPVPQGKTFNKEEVNVDFTGTSGTKEPFVKFDSKEACQSSGSGWHYDNPSAPTSVLACPQTCTKIQADNNAKIEIAFGCKSRPPIM